MFLSKYPHDRILNVNYASFWEPELDGFFQESKETTFGTLNRISSSSCHVYSLFETAAIRFNCV
jgi:hypothetical protein